MPAADQLGRVLYILPTAARKSGVPIAELAQSLNVSAQTVLTDIEEVTTREFYHAAGSAQPFTVSVVRGRVYVHAPAEFMRPPRLNEREALALALGLRALAAEAEPDRRAQILTCAARLEDALQSPEVALQPRVRDEEAVAAAEEGTFVEAALGSDDFRGMIADAIEDGRICAIEYLKPGQGSPEDRRVVPQQLIYANGKWYFAAYDLRRADSRVFRMDRLLKVELHPEKVADAPVRPEMFAFDDDEGEVVVRYSARIGRWIMENGEGEVCADGSVRVRYPVVDARWLVRHVLQYGGEAVVESSPYREMVAKAARVLKA